MDASWPEVIPHLAQAKGGGCGFRFLRGVLGKFGFLRGYRLHLLVPFGRLWVQALSVMPRGYAVDTLLH